MVTNIDILILKGLFKTYSQGKALNDMLIPFVLQNRNECRVLFMLWDRKCNKVIKPDEVELVRRSGEGVLEAATPSWDASLFTTLVFPPTKLLEMGLTYT